MNQEMVAVGLLTSAVCENYELRISAFFFYHHILPMTHLLVRAPPSHVQPYEISENCFTASRWAPVRAMLNEVAFALCQYLFKIGRFPPVNIWRWWYVFLLLQCLSVSENQPEWRTSGLLSCSRSASAVLG